MGAGKRRDRSLESPDFLACTTRLKAVIESRDSWKSSILGPG
jgi:hypothetical protein